MLEKLCDRHRYRKSKYIEISNAFGGIQGYFLKYIVHWMPANKLYLCNLERQDENTSGLVVNLGFTFSLTPKFSLVSQSNHPFQLAFQQVALPQILFHPTKNKQ